MTELLTCNDIADALNVNRTTVLRKSGLDAFFERTERMNDRGRAVNLYSPDALSLWLKKPAELKAAQKKIVRKIRADRGDARIYPEHWDDIVQLTRDFYINMAGKRASLRHACRHTADAMANVSIEIDAERVYRRLARKPNALFSGSEFFNTDNTLYSTWEDVRRHKFRIKDEAMGGATLRYVWWKIFENSGLAGEGFGARKIIVLDDFKRDAWVVKNNKLTMPLGIAYRDGLTGYPLHIEITDSITTAAVAAGIIKTAMKWGFDSETVWVMENSRAMKNINIAGLVSAMYTPEELGAITSASWIKQIFAGQNAPIARNIPYIPRFPFKASVERMFRVIKDEFDATRFPLNYQGGDRSEATQLTLAGAPMIIQEHGLMLADDVSTVPSGYATAQDGEYWEALLDWMYSDMIQTPRPNSLGEWATTHNSEPTLLAIDEYYRAPDPKRLQLDIKRLALLLYWAQPERRDNLVTIKQSRGYMVTINGRQINLIAPELTRYKHYKVATIPIPNTPDSFFVVNANNKHKPELICIARDYSPSHISQIPAMRSEIKQIRATEKRDLDEASSRIAVWENNHEPIAQPEAEEIFTPTEEKTIENNNLSPDEQVSPDVQRLLDL